MTEFQQHLRAELEGIFELLSDKNRKYGNSALEPIRIFSKASPIEQIKVRLDDKMSRIVSSQRDDDEDVYLDLLGYLLILRVAQRIERRTSKILTANEVKK